jgi:hydroxyacylglutathione hydrolase
VQSEQFYFRQLLSGRDFAIGDPVAQQMVNFVYAIGDRSTGECVLVDPAYAPGELLDAVEADGMRCTGVLVSHYHADHVGGSMMGYSIDGVASLLERADCPIHVQRAEAPWVMRTTGVGEAQLAQHDAGDVVSVGGVDITLVHTPGHTPGSQCFHVQGRLISGDTLFLEGCGRTDLPGSNAEDMYHSLQTLATLADDTIVYPGHRYSQPASATMQDVRQTNYVFKPKSVDAWMQWFGGA